MGRGQEKGPSDRRAVDQRLYKKGDGEKGGYVQERGRGQEEETAKIATIHTVYF